MGQQVVPTSATLRVAPRISACAANRSPAAVSKPSSCEGCARRGACVLEADAAPGFRADDALQLREAHHRIKNDLQIVASLLTLQSRECEGADSRLALKEAALRVTAMARLHEQLQATADERVEIGPLLTGICQDFAGKCAEANKVTLKVSVAGGLLDGDRAGALALILNELLVNAMKHAFAGRGGKLSVAFRRVASSGELTVTDDGPGLPTDGARPSALGLSLVGQLAGKLGGKLVHERPRGGGARFRVAFPIGLREACRMI